MSILTGHLTYDDLQRIRETRRERLELIEGELFVTPSPTRLHQLVSQRFIRHLLRPVTDAGIGEFHHAAFDVKLGPDDVVQPDLLVVRNEHRQILTMSGIEGVPDFVVEIVSPTTGRYDRETKRDLYARYGVPEYWLVDPDARVVTIYTNPRDGRYTSEQQATSTAVSTVIPGLSVALADLFSPVPES